MGRASYQHIDNIVIGKGPVSVSLVKRNHKRVKVFLPGARFSPDSPTSYSSVYKLPKPVRPKLKIKT